MEVRLLGPVTVVLDGDEAVVLDGARSRAVLALLAVRGNEWVHRDVVIDELWADDPPKTARNSVQRFVSDLRSALGPARARIESANSSYRLRLESDECDVGKAERLIQEAEQARAASDLSQAADAYGQALALWRGPSLSDVTDIPTVDIERIRLDELRAVATEEAFAIELKLGRHNSVLAELSAAAAAHPFRERIWKLQMIALYRAGRQADALDAASTLRTTLREQLGLDPSESIRDLEAQILAQTDDLLFEAATPRPLDRYHLGTAVSNGQNVEVRTATIVATGREVALATTAPETAGQADFVRSFDNKLRTLGAIEHRGLTNVIDGWRDGDGAHVVTDPYPGSDLARSGSTSPAAGRKILRDVGAALAALHEVGLQHGAVEASAVWLDGEQPMLSSAAIDYTASDPLTDVAALLQLASDFALDMTSAAEATSIIDVLALLDQGKGDSSRLVNPYKGLRAFQESDAPDFEGRSELIQRLVAAVAERRTVMVVGPSGAGKSSAVRAGLIPALRKGAVPGSDAWFVVTMTPGPSPFRELAAALSTVAVDAPTDLVGRLAADEDAIWRIVDAMVPGSGQVLVIVDQFEELFTQLVGESARQRFITGLVRAVSEPRSRIRLVATIRADFFDRPLADLQLSELVQAGTVIVGPMATMDLDRAVVNPAQRVGVSFAPGVVSQLVADVADQPAGLPLLQHALREMFDARDGSVITMDDYSAVGGVQGALATRADSVYRTFDAAQKHVAQQVLLRLVTIDETGGVTRRRAGRDELLAVDDDAARVEHVIEEFGRHRLLTFDRDALTRDPTVEVAHEALLDGWDRLARWVDENRTGVVMHRRVASAAAEWMDHDRDTAYLAVGAQLDQIEAWYRSSDLTLTKPEAAFVAASTEERRTAREVDEARQRRERDLERQAVRRLRLVLAVVALSAVVAFGLSAVAVRQQRQANEQADASERQRLIASARAELSDDPELALLLSIEAAERFTNAGVEIGSELTDVMHEALATDRLLSTVEQATAAQLLSDGRIVTISDAGQLRLVEANGDVLLESGAGHDGPAISLDIDQDGKRAVSMGVDGRSLVWDVDTGLILMSLPVDDPTLARLSPDGQTIAVGSFNGEITLWDARSGELLASRIASGGNGLDPVFTWSNNTELLLVSTNPEGASLVRIDGATLDALDHEPREFKLGRGGVTSVCGLAIDPSGTKAAVGSLGGQPLIIDLESGRVDLIDAGTDSCAIAFGDGFVAVGGVDSKIRVVSTEESRVRFTLNGHTAAVTTLSLSSTGDRLVTAGGDGSARLWDLTRTRPAELAAGGFGNTDVGNEQVGHITFVPDGSAAILTGATRVAALDVGASFRERFGVSGTTVAGNLPGSGDFWVSGRPAISADGATVAVGLAGSGRVVLVDGTSGDEIGLLDSRDASSTDFVSVVRFGPVDERLVGVSTTGVVTVWDVARAEVISSFDVRPTGPFLIAAFVDGSREILVADLTGEVEILDATSGASVRSWEHGGPIVDALLTPSGTNLLTAGVDGIIQNVNVATGQVEATWTTGATLTSLAVNPSGEVFAASSDGVIRRWSQTGELLGTPGHFDGRVVLAATADGRHLLVAGLDGLQLLTTDSAELLEVAQARVTRSLTAAECRRFDLGATCGTTSSTR